MGPMLRVRAGFPAAQPTQTYPVVIVGGGIAGLSAAWRLRKRGFTDFVLLEMNAQPGGNARWGQNEITAYPWAAHYVPVPDRKSTRLNSSHRCISYAVFCLKKKNRNSR